MANKSFQVMPTNENVFKTLMNNTLGNNEWIYKCLNVMLTMDNAILAFDADWGNGKTFLAKEFQMIINEKWEMNRTGRSESEYYKIKGLDFYTIIDNSYYAIYYNAWEHDDDNNPMASFMYHLLKIIEEKVDGEKFASLAIRIINNVIERLTNGWIKLNTEGKSNPLKDVLKSVVETENIRNEINYLLNELKAEKFDNIVIFIDELDRCRPTYALKIIEMLKHYLKMDNILVVCMTDLKQLSNCIKNVYGNEYDTNMYMDKIFDFKFIIPTLKYDKKAYIRMKLNTYVTENYYFDIVCMEVIKYLDLSLRNIDKYLSYVGKMFEFSKDDDNNDFTARAFVEFLFVPYYIGMMLFKTSEIDSLLKYDFKDYENFCKRGKILEIVKHIYERSLGKKYDETQLFEYFKNDCDLMLHHIKGEKKAFENYYVNKGTRLYGVNDYLENIDMLEFFIKNTMN